jgi:phenylacetate-CoA ligase
MRKRLEEGFALKEHGGGARNVYGATELCGPGAGQECIYESGFHFWSDQWYLEIIDPKTNEQVSPGEEGEMVVTHLNREGMPLVRYRLRDLTVIDDSGCECGRNAYPRCLWIRGRTDDVIYYKGMKIYPTAIQEALMKFPEVVEYQVVVDKSNPDYTFDITIELGKNHNPRLEQKINFELNKILFARPTVTFVKSGSLPRFEGKSKRIIEKV